MDTFYNNQRDKPCQAYLPDLLRLRYGTPTPSANSTPLFSIAVVAKYLNLNLRRAKLLVQNYFRTLAAQSRPSARYSPSQAEIDAVLDPDTMAALAPLSLKERVKYLKEEFNFDQRFALSHLTKVYKHNKVRYKDIKLVKRNFKYSDQDFEDMA